MRELSPAEILELWEEGRDLLPADRAARLFEAAGVETESVSVGHGDRRLLDLHTRTFGPRLAGLAICGECGEQAEIDVDTDDVRAEEPATPEGVLELEHGGWRVRFRLPGPADLAAIATAADVTEGRLALLARCVLRAERGGRAASAGRLPARVAAAVAARMEEADPQASIDLSMACPSCGAALRATLDPAEFLWAAAEAQARRLLLEVDALARAYGWREPDVLALPPARRRAYLELVG